jgi:hypothetical protein
MTQTREFLRGSQAEVIFRRSSAWRVQDRGSEGFSRPPERLVDFAASLPAGDADISERPAVHCRKRVPLMRPPPPTFDYNGPVVQVLDGFHGLLSFLLVDYGTLCGVDRR